MSVIETDHSEEVGNIGNVRPLSDEEISTFRDQGVVLVRELINRRHAEELLAAADHWAQNPSEYAENMATDGSFVEGREIWPHEDSFRKFVFESQLAEQAARAMGAKEVRFYFDHLFLLAPNTAKDNYYWHQDLPYWACEGRQICSFWLALTSNTVDSGALEFVLDTDKGELYLPEAFGDGETGDYSVDPDEEVVKVPAYHLDRRKYQIISFDVEPGDALLFNARIMHSSRGNHSKDTRRVAYSTRWIGEDMVYCKRPGFQDPVTIPKSVIEDGDSLAIDQFPKVWPLN